MGEYIIGGSVFNIRDNMKNKKTVREFHFLDLSKKEIMDLMNSDHPINIKKFEPIIDKIYSKYPLIDKSQISLIVKMVFESMRDFLVMGYVINFNKFVFDMKLNFFVHVIRDKVFPALRVRLKNPPKIRENE